jgi:hypothetical protein
MQFMESDNYNRIISDIGPGEDLNLTNEDLEEISGGNAQALSKNLLLRILYNIRESTKEQIFKVKGRYRSNVGRIMITRKNTRNTVANCLRLLIRY